MTLAVLFLLVIFGTPSAHAPVAEDLIALQTTPASSALTAKQDQATADHATPPPAQNPTPSSKPPSSSANPKPASPTQTPAAKPHHKKRLHPANCGTMPSAASATGSAPAAGDSAAATSPTLPATAATPCPPKKVIVRQGGTSEPSIQLAGGPAVTETSNQRDPAHQMLDTTEANLKKLGGKQLTPNQQDLVNQTRQFMRQSKEAVEAGDLERARTLAWKAQVLSEELVKPEK